MDNQGCQHHEVCKSAQRPTRKTHNHIRDLLAQYAKSAKRRVTIEPPLSTQNNPARADIIVSDAEGSMAHETYADLTIKMLLAADTIPARNAAFRAADNQEGPADIAATLPAVPRDTDLHHLCRAQIVAALEKAVADKMTHYEPLLSEGSRVVPLVVSSGGSIHKLFQSWLKEFLSPDLSRQLVIDISLALVRARAATYVLQ